MELSQRNLTFLSLRGELIGTTVYTDAGHFKVLELLDYDSMTHTFLLSVQNMDTLIVSNRDFSDKQRYTVEQNEKREYPNDKRLKPSKSK